MDVQKCTSGLGSLGTAPWYHFPTCRLRETIFTGSRFRARVNAGEIFAYGIRTTGRLSSYSKFYYALRLYLHRNPRLLRLAYMLRGLLVLGPLRPAFVRYYKRFHANKPTTNLTVVFPHLNADEIVKRIEEHGYSLVGNLSETYLNQILAYCEANKRIRYWNPHKDCEAVDCISRDAKIVEIARKYLGVEPILWLTELKWRVPRLEDRATFLSSGYIEPVDYASGGFHYDIHDVKSLTLFIYLTDSDMDSSPHVLIEGGRISVRP